MKLSFSKNKEMTAEKSRGATRDYLAACQMSLSLRNNPQELPPAVIASAFCWCSTTFSSSQGREMSH